MTESPNLATMPPLGVALAVGLLILAIISQTIQGARFAMRAALFFGGMAGFGLLQGWPAALSNPQAQSIELFRGYAWLVDAALAGLFLVMALILTLGRGRGGRVALVVALLILAGGLAIRFGGWPDPVSAWSPPPPVPSQPGTIPLAIGVLSTLAALGALVLQRKPAATPETFGGTSPAPLGSAPLPAWMTRDETGGDEEEDGGELEEEEEENGSERSAVHPAPELGQPWTPLRKRSIRRHRARRVTRNGH